MAGSRRYSRFCRNDKFNVGRDYRFSEYLGCNLPLV
jgi:hypothetical protein